MLCSLTSLMMMLTWFSRNEPKAASVYRPLACLFLCSGLRPVSSEACQHQTAGACGCGSLRRTHHHLGRTLAANAKPESYFEETSDKSKMRNVLWGETDVEGEFQFLISGSAIKKNEDILWNCSTLKETRKK